MIYDQHQVGGLRLDDISCMLHHASMIHQDHACSTLAHPMSVSISFLFDSCSYVFPQFPHTPQARGVRRSVFVSDSVLTSHSVSVRGFPTSQLPPVVPPPP